MKTDRPTEEARKLANEYLVEWCSNYQNHGDLAKTDWDGSLAEYHLANFLTRNTAGLRSLVGELADELGSAYPHGEHPEEVTQLLSRAREEARKP